MAEEDTESMRDLRHDRTTLAQNNLELFWLKEPAEIWGASVP